MSYQNTSESFAARTSARGTEVSSVISGILHRGFAALSAMMTSIGNGFIVAADASSRRDKIEALEAKSDAELAKMGIKRDNIVHHVFKDLYYC